MAKADKKTLDLIKEVKRRKEEISKAERPNWKTNCSFSPTNGRQNDAINLHVTKDVQTLVSCAALLREQERAYNEAATDLSVDAPEFTWGGFPVSEWLDDIKTRINKTQIATKKSQLEKLETRLNAIISPELRRDMELEAIAAELD